MALGLLKIVRKSPVDSVISRNRITLFAQPVNFLLEHSEPSNHLFTQARKEVVFEIFRAAEYLRALHAAEIVRRIDSHHVRPRYRASCIRSRHRAHGTWHRQVRCSYIATLPWNFQLASINSAARLLTGAPSLRSLLSGFGNIQIFRQPEVSLSASLAPRFSLSRTFLYTTELRDSVLAWLLFQGFWNF